MLTNTANEEKIIKKYFHSFIIRKDSDYTMNIHNIIYIIILHMDVCQYT